MCDRELVPGLQNWGAGMADSVPLVLETCEAVRESLHVKASCYISLAFSQLMPTAVCCALGIYHSSVSQGGFFHWHTRTCVAKMEAWHQPEGAREAAPLMLGHCRLSRLCEHFPGKARKTNPYLVSL